MIRVRDITLPFDHDAESLAGSLLERLGISERELVDFSIIRKAIDARHKNRILAVYTVDAEVQNESEVLGRFSGDGRVFESSCVKYQVMAARGFVGSRPVVVGSGPCGLFAGLVLGQMGLRPVLIERGKEIGARVKDVQKFWRDGVLDAESNVQFGEGGAGTFSDGKLTTQIKDKYGRLRKVLDEFVRAGAPEEILYEAKAHIGTDNLVGIVKNIRNRMISLGGEVRFGAKLTGIKIEGGKVAGAVVNEGEIIETDSIVLALGHSARDTFSMLERAGAAMEAKAFSMGVRIEHPQSLIDKAQYGRFASHELLGGADYKLVHHCENGRAVYSFCMCPGGEVIAASSEYGGVVTNGMSSYSRNGVNGNSALLVSVRPSDFGGSGALAGIEFQRVWERKAFEVGGSDYFAPVQLVGDFLLGRRSGSFGEVLPSYRPGVRLSDLSECLPGFVVESLREAIPELDKKLRGFGRRDAVMTGVESRSSSPVRIVRDEFFQSPSVRGLYPAGEGAGYAGGIISSAVDGIKVAEAVCEFCSRGR